LDDLKAYAVMLAEPVLFLQFVEALVKQDRIDNLLRCTEQLKMPQRCVQLLQLYFKYWPNHAPAADEMGDYDKLAKVCVLFIIKGSIH
jgi:hypothetical protein